MEDPVTETHLSAACLLTAVTFSNALEQMTQSCYGAQAAL